MITYYLCLLHSLLPPCLTLKTFILWCPALVILPVFPMSVQECFSAELSQMNGCLGRAVFAGPFTEFKARRKHYTSYYSLSSAVLRSGRFLTLVWSSVVYM